jgi:hypothetical protein
VTEEEWLCGANPEVMLWTLSEQFPAGKEYDDFTSRGRQLRLFAIACCRHVGHLLTDPRSREALTVFEHYLEGLATRTDKAWAEETSSDVIRVLEEATDGRCEAAMAVHRTIDFQDEFTDAFEVAGIAAQAATFAAGDPEEDRDRREKAGRATEEAYQATLLRDIFGNPFHPVAFSPSWHTDTALSLARLMYESRDFSAMPILADALQDAGCDNDAVLTHLRDPHATHVRGCWALDLVLGKE